MNDFDYLKAIEIMKKSQSVLVITGAGISADSGLPTYRGVGGLYEDQLTDEGIEIEEALSIHMFHQNPSLVWKYLKQIISAVEDKTYNISHKVLAEWEKEKPHFWILTQNVDGFHKQAGSKNVLEIHGNLKNLVCLNCGFRKDIESYKTISIPPYCERCGSVLKPDVVLFGEYLPWEKVFLYETILSYQYDLILIIGTSGVFPYIYEPVFAAFRKGIFTIEINPNKTIFSDNVKLFFPERASVVLEKLWELYKNQA
ncbi:MAG: NAD-dependent protein deacylase [Leptospiraceae bacterium]|nr:NAD-dependent protein deacylase [Leptospiraceae bacterium]MDW7976048.1 NAD-dependent protein deacylase [Leptospiraceae bacterium]